MQSSDSRRSRKRPRGIHVRVSDSEWERISGDERLLRWSKPRILREAYLSSLPIALVFDKEGERRFLAEFNRIGNNINQLARKVNTGGVISDTELTAVKEQLIVLLRYFREVNGRR